VVLASCLAFAAAAALRPPPPRADVHLDEAHGLRVEVPAGWRAVDQDRGEEGFTLFLVPPDAPPGALLAFSVREMGAGEGVDALVERALAKIAAEEAFSAPERLSVTLLGEERPALRVRLRSAEGELAVVAAFLVDDGRGYVVQRSAPPEVLERWSEAFAPVIETFAPVAVDERTREARRLAELARGCGSGVDWAPSWVEAARRARELGRPVLVVAWSYHAFELPSSPRSTIFMDPDVLELVATRFVPWWLSLDEPSAFAQRYGLSRTTLGQGVLVATPDGEVLAETTRATVPLAVHAFLCDVLARHPDASRAQAPAPGASALERARFRVARGELEAALEALEDDSAPPSPEGRVLAARVHRLRRDGEAAWAALEAARAAGSPSSPELERARLVEEARTGLHTGRSDAVRAAAERLADAHAASDEAGEAALLLALAEVQAGEREAARARLLALAVAEGPRACQAAALLSGGALDLDVAFDFGFPDEAVLAEALAPPPLDPLDAGGEAPDRATAARDGALAWLLANQRADGSWISPAELSAADESTHRPFVEAITALGVRALLPHRDEAAARDAVERGIDSLLAAVERRKTRPSAVLFMDFTPWSDAALLDAFAAALAAGVGDPERLRDAAAEALDDLLARRQPHGGWGYYVTNDLDGAAQPPTAMSFTTAAAVLALARARAAGLVPAAELERAAAALAAMRDDDGVFAYSVGRGGGAGVPAGMEPGAAGRAPACELALLRAGASDADRVERALGVFLRHAGSYAAERGKVLMHAGPQAQGCHYVLFDYGWAAAAWREVAGDRATRARLVELLLDCRRADGSFLDTPVNGRAYGTAMALLALDALGA